MTNNTKARIDINNGIIDLEGNEEFVTKYLDEFKQQLIDEKPIQKKEQFKKPAFKQTATKKVVNKKVAIKPKGAKRIGIEEFDIKGNPEKQVISLSDFIKEKKPTGNAPQRILIMGYYITQILGLEEFTEGHLEFAYQALQLKGRPGHLRQVVNNLKNEKNWFEDGTEPGRWCLGRIGQLYVEEHMPSKQDGD